MEETTTKNIIGSSLSAEGPRKFFSVDPSTASQIPGAFSIATTNEVDRAAKLAATAFQSYRKLAGRDKAIFLEAICDEILKTGEQLISVCSRETALPAGRIENERSRTIAQIRMFVDLLNEGSWVDARIETAMPDRKPLPRPDIRFMQRALGPVLVFGASNFPLAFSVAGGDTVSALAAGCPVIVKAHPAHPATSALVGSAIHNAAQKTGMPDGVFSLLFDDGIEVGMQLVNHPSITAVGFTGSFNAGKAIYDAAARRPVPIPVYAEMSSTNPVFVLPKAASESGTAIAQGLAASVTLGVGQFCTNPGLVFSHENNAQFVPTLKNAFENTKGGVMLTKTIAENFSKKTSSFLLEPEVETLARGEVAGTGAFNTATPLLMSVRLKHFKESKILHEENFGPSSIVVHALSKEEMIKVATELPGQLTASIFGTDDEILEFTELVNILEQKAGRLLFNNFPTGVEVCSAMVHGGPFPATTDSRSTSVGTAAIYRFTRPVCFQNMPQQLLPAELQDANDLQVVRLVNGKRTNEPINLPTAN